MKKIVSPLLFSIFLFSMVVSQGLMQANAALSERLATRAIFSSSGGKIDSALQATLEALPSDAMLTVIVTMKDQMDFSQINAQSQVPGRPQLLQGLQQQAEMSQKEIRASLAMGTAEGKVSRVIPLWIINGLSVTAQPGVIRELAVRDDVARITPDEINIVPDARLSSNPPEANIAKINAPALWSMGYYGQGVVVANMDSGVDYTHPDLINRWRGGSNSWYDPYGQHPTTPSDLSGHGTWTMGVMVAGDAGGTSVGVAPQAQWIAVKIFNDAGTATATAIHLGFQWLLDPDGNPYTADAPQVVNNSWSFGGPGCNLEFQPDLQALRAFGILPVFSAGNYGPNASTSVSPANYPEAFAVGATDNTDQIYSLSSRGPSACGETSSIYPEVVAPGVNINTTDLFGMYYQTSGTSLSAPHVAGGIALLLSAFPGLTADQQFLALLNSSKDLGAAGADNTYGYGRLDLLAAYQLLASGALPTPTAIPPTPTSLPPTPTPTPMKDIIFMDGFETGDLSAWSSASTDGGRLNVSTNAAMDGAWGMQGLINRTTPIYVSDLTPAAESSYHARFYFSPNGVSIRSGKTHNIFVGLSTSGTELFALQLQSSSGNYQVRGVFRLNNGKTKTTNWYTISNASHPIELFWLAASSTKSSDGSFSLWIDGILKETRSGISNGTYRLEEVRLGPQSLVSGIAGTEYFDEFKSTRLDYIGP